MKHRRPFPERGRFVGRAFFGNFRTQNQGRAVKGNDSQHFVAPPEQRQQPHRRQSLKRTYKCGFSCINHRVRLTYHQAAKSLKTIHLIKRFKDGNGKAARRCALMPGKLQTFKRRKGGRRLQTNLHYGLITTEIFQECPFYAGFRQKLPNHHNYENFARLYKNDDKAHIYIYILYW